MKINIEKTGFKNSSQKSFTSKLTSVLMGATLLLLSIWSARALINVNSQYSVEQFFPKNHSLLTQGKEIRRVFQLQERSSVLLVLEIPDTQNVQKQNWLSQERLQTLEKLTHDLRLIDGVQTSFSLGTLEGAHTTDDSIAVGSIFAGMKESEWPTYVRQNKLIHNQLISEDLRAVLIMVTPKPSIDLTQFSKSIQAMKNLSQQTVPEAKVFVGGLPALQSQMTVKLNKELKTFLILSLVLFSFIFFLFFKSLSSLLFTFTSLILGNVVILGTVAAFGIPFSVLLSTLPIIVSIALISVVIHTMHRWAQVYAEKPNQPAFQASLAVLKEMALPNFLGSLTTSFGFITLFLSDIPLIKQYGWIVASAVMAAWLLVYLMMIGFLQYTRPQLRRWTEEKSYWSLFILRKSKILFPTILLLTAVLAVASYRMNFSAKLFDDLAKEDETRVATDHIDEHFGGVVTEDISITSTQEGFWKSPDNLKTLQSSLEKMRMIEEIGSALSVTDFLKNPLPVTQAEVAETFFLYSMSESNPLKNYVTEDARSLRIALRFHDLNSTTMENKRELVTNYLKLQFPKTKIEETGLAVTSHTINQEVSKQLVFGFWHSILIIGVLLMIIFRSIRWTLVACLPNLIPPVVLMGTLALFQTPIKPGIGIIFSIALGLAFNNTVYLLTRLKKMKKEKGLSNLPLKQALLQEGNPCLFETIVMISGFIIFLVSHFKLNQIFGIYMLISIIAGAIGDLMFLPSMLKLFPQLLIKKNKEKMSMRKIAASLVLFMLTMTSMNHQAQANTLSATEVLKKSQEKLESKDEQATIEMKITEANGETKIRKIKLTTLRGKRYHALARIAAPADLKGTGFLAEIAKGHEEQWIYLPSTKQVRRVVGAKKSAGILGSELTIDDLNSTAVKDAQVRISKQDSEIIEIEVVPQKGNSIYSKVLLTLSAKEYTPISTHYYEGDKMKKTVSFQDYVKVGKIWRAKLIQVKNLTNQRSTDLEFTDMKTNLGLQKEDFTVSALKE